MARPRTDARERLLADVLAHLTASGGLDMSLRQLADAIGTSHRMLLFHFGSKEQLQAEVVRAVEAQQRDLLASTVDDPDRPAMAQMELLWAHLLEPTLRPNIRLFFQVYGNELRHGRSTPFLDEVVTSWLEPTTAAIARTSPDTAAADARLALALVRGLLLDLVTTGDVDAVDAAMQRFSDLYTATTGVRSTPSARRRPRASAR